MFSNDENGDGISTDADLIRDYLSILGMSQREAARELKVEERTFRYYCAGTTEAPPVVTLALRHLVQMHRNNQLVKLVEGGTITPPGAESTVERLREINDTLRAANAILLRPLQATEEELVGDCIRNLDSLTRDPTQTPQQIEKIQRTMRHWRTRFSGMLDRGLAMEEIAQRYGLSPDWLRGFLKECAEGE